MAGCWSDCSPTVARPVHPVVQHHVQALTDVFALDCSSWGMTRQTVAEDAHSERVQGQLGRCRVQDWWDLVVVDQVSSVCWLREESLRKQDNISISRIRRRRLLDVPVFGPGFSECVGYSQTPLSLTHNEQTGSWRLHLTLRLAAKLSGTRDASTVLHN